MTIESIDAAAVKRGTARRTPAAGVAVSDVDAVVIGAGMSGLSTADHLAGAGLRVVVLEAGPAAGGLARSVSVGDEPIEAYYHHIFPQDLETRDLLLRLGLADDLEWHLGRMGVLSRGRAFPFDTPVDLLRLPLLPWHDRLRVGLATLVQVWRRDAANLDRTPAATETRRWYGPRAYDVLWSPLLEAKFGVRHHGQIPMAWLVARIRQRAGARRAVGDRLGYLRGSLGRLIAAYVDDITSRGVRILTSARVTSVARSGDLWVVTAEHDGLQRMVRARVVVAAVAAPVLLRLVDVPDPYRSWVSSIKYRGVVCILVELDRSLSGYYWVNVLDGADSGCVGIIEHTNLIPRERYGGRTVLYLAYYVDHAEEAWTAPAEALLAAVEPCLRRLNPTFDPSWITGLHVSRDPYAQPIPIVGGPMPGLPVETGLPGLFHASLAHVYPDDRGVSQALRLGGRAALSALAYLHAADRAANAR